MVKKIKVEEVKEEVKVNPSDAMSLEDAKKVRAPGGWIKVTAEELAIHESNGVLKGYDPASGEALLKEE